MPDQPAMDALGSYDGLMQACIGGSQVHASHRLQAWDFSEQQIPDMTDGEQRKCPMYVDYIT